MSNSEKAAQRQRLHADPELLLVNARSLSLATLPRLGVAGVTYGP